MRHIVVCGLSGSTIFFQHYFINGKIFGGKILNTTRVFRFSLLILSETFLILGRIRGDTINANEPSCKVPFILVRF